MRASGTGSHVAETGAPTTIATSVASRSGAHVRDLRCGLRADAPGRPLWGHDERTKEVRGVAYAEAADGAQQHDHQLVHASSHDLADELHLLLYPLTLGSGKRLPDGVYAKFSLTSATPYPSGVVGLHYARPES
jgi:hypothetical protein